MARIGGTLLPPYATGETLDRLEAEIVAVEPRTVICLGDSFDDMSAARDLLPDIGGRLDRLSAGRRWIWIAGNHDPGPLEMPGTHLAEFRQSGLTFRHIADPASTPGEISGHYHPKVRTSTRGLPVGRACFLADQHRLILPAFGTYTGGLDVSDRAFEPLFGPDAVALVTGRRVTTLPRLG